MRKSHVTLAILGLLTINNVTVFLHEEVLQRPVTEGLRTSSWAEYTHKHIYHTPNHTQKMLRTTADKERVRKKEISSVVIKMKNGSPATLNKS